jgi:malonyl CoA-acyl carrier protein transacylase
VEVSARIVVPDPACLSRETWKSWPMTKIFVFPGQGSQKAGMGADLFPLFRTETAQADAILGYSIEDLCTKDPHNQLGQTNFTQPALFVVNALSYLKRSRESGQPNFVAGHSLGEYNALFAAGVFEFETGLRLVQKRGELMSKATGGGMAAIIGLSIEKIRSVLQESNLKTIDVANLNTPAQVVISGPKADVEQAHPFFEQAGARMVVPLKVSGAFHSRYMEGAKTEFEAFLKNFGFRPPAITVISNVEAQPAPADKLKELLGRQITHSVRWAESIQYLLKQPEPVFEEVGPGTVLTSLIKQIKAAS